MGSTEDFGSKQLQLPIGTAAKNRDLVEKHICFGPVLDSTYNGSIKRWRIYVKQLDGTKTTVELEDHGKLEMLPFLSLKRR